MTIIDKRQPKPRRAPESHKSPKPYEVHRAAFTDGDGTNPPTMAVDAQPRAEDPGIGHPIVPFGAPPPRGAFFNLYDIPKKA